MNLLFLPFIIARLVSLGASQDLANFIHDYYGSCSSTCIKQVHDWQGSSSCINGHPCESSLDDAVFFEKLVCCIAQSEGCPSNIDTINQNINEWYSRDSDVNPPNQTSLKDTLPLPTTCSPTQDNRSPAAILTRRGVLDYGNEKDEENTISGGAMAGIVVVSLAVSLGFVICIASSCKRNAQRTQPKPYVLPLHTARRLSAQRRSNTPRRPAPAIVRGGTPPPPPPYTKDDEPAPRYEASWRN